jgi:hypothetical protein
MQAPAFDTTMPTAVRPTPFGALAFVLATLVTLFMLAHHPVAAGAMSQAERLDQIIQLGAQDELVHGVLIGVIGLLVYGVVDLSLALGIGRPLVAAGLAAYVLGCASVTGAMLLDGFVTPQAALRIWQQGATAMQGASPAFAVLGSCIQVLTKAGQCAMGVGMLAWSAASWNQRDARVLALLGIVAGFLPPVLIALSGVRLQPHLLMWMAAAMGAWNLAAARHLWKRG